MIIELFVIKRDGRLEEFSPKKIEDAVKKAFVSVDGEDVYKRQILPKLRSEYECREYGCSNGVKECGRW